MLTCSPTSRLSKVDLPTLGRPMSATMPLRDRPASSLPEFKPLQSLARCLLFGGPPRAAFATSAQRKLRDLAFDDERLLVRFARCLEHLINRDGQRSLL